MTAAKAISQIGTKWRLFIWLKIIAAWLMILTFGYLTFLPVIPFSWQAFFSVTVFAVIFLLFRNQLPTKADIYHLINSQVPTLEYSVSLIENEPKSRLGALQREKVKTELASQSRAISYPVGLKDLIWVGLTAGALALAISLLSTQSPSIQDRAKNEALDQKKEPITTSQRTTYSVRVSVNAPDYTGLKNQHQVDPDLNSVLKGSIITWQLDFSNAPRSAWLKFSNEDSIHFKGSDKQFSRSIKASTKGFYTINFMDKDGGLNVSDFYKLEIIPDNPPEVQIDGIPQYQSIYPGEANGTKFTASATDEFGLSDAYLVATITKGSGESVKFREEKIPFKKSVKSKSFTEEVRFTLEQFDMEPGNELYFYLEAWDNQVPPKANRTETYFFVLEDTAEIAFSLEGNLGVDLMPEYFRSQRQIIIDSEKLLAEKSSISKEEFNQRSNELGFDQKTLRLKYGQFLGEEADSGLDIENEVDEQPDAGSDPGQVDVLSEFGHDHDHENEEGQLMDKGTEQHENPIEELSHSHDDMDEATFFGESMKGKLKAALNEMWDAELYLRLFKPEESLPYQYKALKLIKEIKNHARIYVHRMGFDAPPLKESESRLTGDLDHVHGEHYRTTTEYHEDFEATRSLIEAISKIEKETFPQANSLVGQLQSTGNEIARKAIEEPGKYLQLLSDIRQVSDQEELTQKDVVRLKLKLLRMINEVDQKPTLDQFPSHELIDQFVEELTKSNP